MSHRNTPCRTTADNQPALAPWLVDVHSIAIFALVLVLLIINGGAG